MKGLNSGGICLFEMTATNVPSTPSAVLELGRAQGLCQVDVKVVLNRIFGGCAYTFTCCGQALSNAVGSVLAAFLCWLLLVLARERRLLRITLRLSWWSGSCRLRCRWFVALPTFSGWGLPLVAACLLACRCPRWGPRVAAALPFLHRGSTLLPARGSAQTFTWSHRCAATIGLLLFIVIEMVGDSSRLMWVALPRRLAWRSWEPFAGMESSGSRTCELQKNMIAGAFLFEPTCGPLGDSWSAWRSGWSRTHATGRDNG